MVFPSILKENNLLWQEGKVVLCQGKLSDKDQEVKLLCNKVMELTAATTAEAVNKFVANGQANGQARKIFVQPPAKLARPPASEFLALNQDKIYINLNGAADAALLERLKQTLAKNVGDKKVFFKLSAGGRTNLVETDFKINYSQTLIEEINRLLDKKRESW